MRLGYNTNGFCNHRWPEAIALLAEIGYQSVALTVDHSCLDPYAESFPQERERLYQQLRRLNLRCVIETGARFLLNPRLKHEPTLVSATTAERAVRREFLVRCIDLAADVNADAVSLWSGILRTAASRSAAMTMLADELHEVLKHAERRNVKLAFEPEPGMFIATFADFRELQQRLNHPLFGLTVDIGHVQCLETLPIAAHLREWSPLIWNVHLEDMVRGVHDHLRFGAGEIDFPAVMAALREIGYTGGVHVELSRHSHMAYEVACESFSFLQQLCPTAPQIP